MDLSKLSKDDAEKFEAAMSNGAKRLIRAGMEKLPDNVRFRPDVQALVEAVAHMIVVGMTSSMVLLMEHMEKQG